MNYHRSLETIFQRLDLTIFYIKQYLLIYYVYACLT